MISSKNTDLEQIFNHEPVVDEKSAVHLHHYSMPHLCESRELVSRSRLFSSFTGLLQSGFDRA